MAVRRKVRETRHYAYYSAFVSGGEIQLFLQADTEFNLRRDTLILMARLYVGIDEVGRGPLAGPVAVGIAVCAPSFSMAGLTDSKKMTEKARERIVAEARKMMSAGELRFGVFSAPASRIDEGGIERTIRSLIRQGIARLAPDPDSVEVYLDGRLSAPQAYRQETIIRGDFLVPVISLASVVAKVARDRYMTHVMHPKFPEYGFDAHKGYGTASHIAAIRTHGPSEIHRMSFLRNILPAHAAVVHST